MLVAPPPGDTLSRKAARSRQARSGRPRTWWLTHRQGAPNALRDELRAARDLLTRTPGVGRVDEEQDGKTRRLLLPTTRYVVFYRVYPATQEVLIVAVWHSSREAPEL